MTPRQLHLCREMARSSIVGGPITALLAERDALAERVEKAEAEVEALKHDVERHIAIASSEADYAEKLHKALRLRSIHPIWAGNFSAQVGQMCVLCGAETTHGILVEPPHAESCLATPSAPKGPQQTTTGD